jgi:hypothetical protein
MIFHVKLFSSLRHAHLHNFANDTEWKINSKKKRAEREDKEAQTEKFYLAAILLASKAKPLPSFFFCCFYLKSFVAFTIFFLELRLFPSVMVAAEHSRNGREKTELTVNNCT